MLKKPIKKLKSKFLAVLSAAAISLGASAIEFTTDCVTGSSARNTNGSYSVQNPLHTNDGQYTSIGMQNSYHVSSYLWAQLPTNHFTGATIVCPVALTGRMNTINMDIWSIGTIVETKSPGRDLTAGWHTYDDTTPTLAEYTTKDLNGYIPVKVLDNAVPAGTSLTKDSTVEFSSDELIRQIVLAFYRGATMNEYLLLRFTPDGMVPNDGHFRFSGWTTQTVAESNRVAGVEAIKAMHIRYTGRDDLPAPVPRLSADEQSSEEYIRSAIKWVQYRDSDGTSGFEYPVYCGVKDGKTRDLYFTVDLPSYTLTNAWLTLHALPPFTGTVPADASVQLTLEGIVDGPASNQNFVVTNGMFTGQTPLVLQENILRGGLSSGKSLFTRRVGQRDLIRALNAGVVDAATVKAIDPSRRHTVKAVFRLAVSSPAGSDDWGFSLGTAATPGVESVLEGIEYRKRIPVFTNTGFENGLEGWSVPGWCDQDHVAVVQDPVDPQNNCLRLRLKNIPEKDNPITDISLIQYRKDSALIEAHRGKPYYLSYRVYMPSSAPIIRRDSARLTAYGHYIFWGDLIEGSGTQIQTGRTVESTSEKDSWRHEKRFLTLLPEKVKSELRMYLQFRFQEIDRNANEGDTIYYDDVMVEFEDFYEFPEEQNALMLIVR